MTNFSCVLLLHNLCVVIWGKAFNASPSLHRSSIQTRRRPFLDGADCPSYVDTSESDGDEPANNAEVTDDEETDDEDSERDEDTHFSPQNQPQPTHHHVPPPMAENPIPDSPMQWHSDYIPYLDSLQGREDAFVFTRDDDQSRQKRGLNQKIS
ncbi:uncharacterized protein LOC132632330 [Lycium barbarum]|uniref:uncharacterized protein LOC132632330 n=1 Tax=Lycium barbarum TaxID=112863 RepID=UPI00293E881B|nr:uncharacterized protein LOC132632330 [Lycium barbarum]